MPPEWFDTINAPPAAGTDSKPRTSARKYFLMNGPAFLYKLLGEDWVPLTQFGVIDFVVAHSSCEFSYLS